MYILYIDESGNPDEPADKHFVLGGVAVFERAVHFLSAALDAIQTTHFPGAPPIEFHASQIRSGKGFWRDIDRTKRETLLREIAKTVASARGVKLFSAVIEKSDSVYGEDAVRFATEQMCKRFDTMLVRHFKDKPTDPQRGLLVFAESHYEQRARLWVKDFRRLGTQWGVLRNLCDIPYFASTRETRMLQIADFVAYAAYQFYERAEDSLIRPMLHRFDRKGGTLHGLFHGAKVRSSCACPACKSRRR